MTAVVPTSERTTNYKVKTGGATVKARLGSYYEGNPAGMDTSGYITNFIDATHSPFGVIQETKGVPADGADTVNVAFGVFDFDLVSILTGSTFEANAGKLLYANTTSGSAYVSLTDDGTSQYMCRMDTMSPDGTRVFGMISPDTTPRYVTGSSTLPQM